MENYKDDVSVKRYGHTSLYTWMRHNITDKITQKRCKSVSLSLFREDGFNLNHDIYHVNYETGGYDEIFNKKASSRVEEAIVAIKNARMHERILLIVNRTGIDIAGNPFDEKEMFIIIRFDDKEYIHATHGRKVKQIISVDQLSTNYIKDYINHFTLSGKISEITKNKKLVSVMSIDSMDYDKLSTLKEKLGEDDLSVISIERSINEIKDLSVVFEALSTEEKNVLRDLPYIGQPNYSITLDQRLRIYLKSSSAESLGNGNAVSLFVDSV